MRDNRKKIEREYGERLEKMPQKIKNIIKFGFVKFNKPKFWSDTRKVIYVNRTIKILIICIWMTITPLVIVTSIMNERNSQWDIHSFYQSGEVKWVNIKKIQ